MRDALLVLTTVRTPLGVSAQVHGYPRPGQSGNPVEALAGAEAVDTSRFPTQSPSGHLYHIFSKEVGRDLEGLLGKGKRATDWENLTKIEPNLWMLDPQDRAPLYGRPALFDVSPHGGPLTPQVLQRITEKIRWWEQSLA